MYAVFGCINIVLFLFFRVKAPNVQGRIRRVWLSAWGNGSQCKVEVFVIVHVQLKNLYIFMYIFILNLPVNVNMLLKN